MNIEDYSFPSQYPSPFSHQVETVKFQLQNPRGFVLNTMGTGKTLSSLWACDLLMSTNRIKTALIVCPLSIVHTVWMLEVMTHMPHRRVVSLHSNSKAKRLQALNCDADFYVINHDGVKVLREELVDKGFDVIVIDELTAFKNPSADITKAMFSITSGPGVKGVWGLSGAPIAQSPVDAYSQGKVVRHDNPDLPKYFGQFKNMIQEKDPYIPYQMNLKDGWEDVVSGILSPSIRFELRDCVDLPPTVYQDRFVKMTSEQLKAYKEMARDYITKIGDDGNIVAVNAGVKYSKLLQISSGAAKDPEGRVHRLNVRPKIKEVINVFNEFGRRPAIVCATFVDTVKMLQEELSKKYRVAMVYGGVSAKERSIIFDGFQKGAYDFLILQPKTAAHGLTLTVSSLLIWFGPFPSNEVQQQTDARIIRPGQTKTQVIVRLYSSDSEKRLYESNNSSEQRSADFLSLIKGSLDGLS